MYQLGCIGMGNMGTAMIQGAVSSGLFSADEVIVSAHSDKTLQKFPMFHTTKNNREVCASEMILLAVKPNLYFSCLEEIKDSIPEGSLLLTVAPGISIEEIQKVIGEKKIVRSMPNIPALIGEGMTGVAFSESCTDEDQNKALAFYRSFGETSVVSESLMRAVCAASGSSPAFVFILIEAMADACVKMGMKRQEAVTFCAKSVEGAAKMALTSESSPAALKDMVCSPQGTTIEGVLALEKSGFRCAIQDALLASYQKAGD